MFPCVVGGNMFPKISVETWLPVRVLNVPDILHYLAKVNPVRRSFATDSTRTRMIVLLVRDEIFNVRLAS